MERSLDFVRRHKLLSVLTVGALSAGAIVGIEFRDQIAKGISILLDQDQGDLPEESPDLVVRTTQFMCFKEVPNCDAGSALVKIYQEGNNVPKPLAEISDAAEQATVAVEDERFFERDGIDWEALIRAAWANFLAGEVIQGGSTITEQLASNLYPESMPHYDKVQRGEELTLQEQLDRRLEEISLARILEKNNSKQAILEKYLNVINYGRGARGIEMAAWAYFGIPASQLTVLQAATLARIPREPGRYEGSKNPERDAAQMNNLLNGRNDVLDAMRDNGYITDEDFAALSVQPLGVKPYEVITYGTTADYTVADALQARHYVDEVFTDFYALPEDQRKNVTHINTTLSYLVQGQVLSAVNQVGSQLINGQQLAIVVLGPDGKVLGEYGGNYAIEQTNLVTSPQPGGSSDKGYFVATALARGAITMETAIPEQLPFIWEGVNNGGPWIVETGAHCENKAACTPADALRNSSNPVILSIVKNMGIEGVADTYKLMENLGSESSSPVAAASVLGARETSVLGRTTMMMNMVANQGNAIKPVQYLASTYRYENGSLVPSFEYTVPGAVRVVDPAIAAQITDALRGVPASGTASGVLGDMVSLTDMAGKTGTDDDNRIANLYLTACISNEQLGQMNLTFGVAERFAEGLSPLGQGHEGGNYPAKTIKTILKGLIGQPCRIN